VPWSSAYQQISRRLRRNFKTSTTCPIHGKIVHIFEKVKPEGHAEEVMGFLKDGKEAAKAK
jgi:hypothetical protein